MFIPKVCPNCGTALEERESEYVCTKCAYSFTKKKANPTAKHSHLIPEKIREKVEQAIHEIKMDLFTKQATDSLLPWKQERWMLIPRANYETGREYTGWNRIFLWSHEDDYFMTRKQVEKLGGKIEKESEGLCVVGWFPLKKKKEETEEQFLERVKGRKFASMFMEIFPWSATSGIPEKVLPTTNKREETIEGFLSRLIADKGMTIVEGGQSAFHVKFKDGKQEVHVPKLGKFVSSDMYYKSMFHEMIHWTGYKLERDMSGKDVSYGREELIAEIGAAALCHVFGINMGTDSTEYINSWMKAIGEDVSILLEASGRAEKAIDFLLN